MILESVFNLFKSTIKLIFAWINIPAAPEEVTTVIDTMITYMRSGIGFLFLFFNMDLVKIMIPFVLIVANFEEVYKLVMFVLRKIPFLGIE